MIDREQRRIKIAEGVWRLISREGVGAVSLRTAAAEAGLVLGSLRHSFPAKDDLLAYSMELVSARVTERVRSHIGLGEPRALVRAMLCELLPLDAERMTEMRANLALIVESPAYPRLGELALAAQQAIGGLCHEACRHLQESGLMDAGREVAAEGRRLHALLDGLAMQLVVAPADSADALALLDRHLDDLATPPRRPAPPGG